MDVATSGPPARMLHYALVAADAVAGLDGRGFLLPDQRPAALGIKSAGSPVNKAARRYISNSNRDENDRHGIWKPKRGLSIFIKGNAVEFMGIVIVIFIVKSATKFGASGPVARTVVFTTKGESTRWSMSSSLRAGNWSPGSRQSGCAGARGRWSNRAAFSVRSAKSSLPLSQRGSFGGRTTARRASRSSAFAK